ncbi:dienelactone hydrolase family protein [Novosphingobium album (ex Hu et al. 2023)]|uniref:Dienelactone hydrolase family protein n=1 Tax=Novosphingobium album (ex Hu et al. 2023) TaxID=2930093 RepID=A0ABT0AXC3_9SPHN|nr:dienelactone hydrolase family protein [Novosphingobium album (ex Hu et al. 2023)]MCJ2177454.1 dienelactone hydrolase family protein [Novosphingobium album (ex Hu et al. 2023)]
MSTLETVSYVHAGKTLTGWLARPAAMARAAVVLFPTIANVNPLMEERARKLAEAGYLTMIADFYGDPVASFEASFPMAAALREDNAYYRGRIGAGIAALRELAPDLPMFAIGHCMGGQAVLEAARAGEDLQAVVSFHGILETPEPAEPGAIKARILVCHGDADPLVPHEQVLQFWSEMNAVNADWHFHAYSQVRHGFTDPDSDKKSQEFLAYSRSADRQSWAAMLSLFDEVLA